MSAQDTKEVIAHLLAAIGVWLSLSGVVLVLISELFVRSFRP